MGVDKKGEQWYQLTLGGRDQSGAQLGKRLGPAIAKDDMGTTIDTLVQTYLAQRHENESFLNTVDRVGVSPFKEPCMPIINLSNGQIVSGDAPTVDLDHPTHQNEPVLAVHFEQFADGRGYSVARLLRRQGYQGILRATGDSGLDQLFYLRRCGFSEAELTEAEFKLLKPIHLAPIPVRCSQQRQVHDPIESLERDLSQIQQRHDEWLIANSLGWRTCCWSIPPIGSG